MAEEKKVKIFDEGQKKLTSFKNFVLNALPNIVWFVVIIFTLGLGNIVIFGINDGFWLNVGWWEQLIVISIGLMSVRAIGQNNVLENKFKLTDGLKELTERFITYSKFVDISFQEYLNIINKENKIKVFKSKLSKKIERNEYHMQGRAKMIWDSGDEKKIRRNLYCRRKKHYDEIMSDKYIHDNIEYIKVKYNYHAYGSFTLLGTDDINPKSKSDIIKAKNKNLALGLISAAMYSALAATIVVQGLNGYPWYAVMFSILLNLMFIIGAYIGGRKGGGKVIQEEIVSPLTIRIQIIGEYCDWFEKTNQKHSFLYRTNEKLDKIATILVSHPELGIDSKDLLK